MMLLLQYTMGLTLKGNQPNMGIEHDITHSNDWWRLVLHSRNRDSVNELTVYLPYVAYGSGGFWSFTIPSANKNEDESTCLK